MAQFKTLFILLEIFDFLLIGEIFESHSSIFGQQRVPNVFFIMIPENKAVFTHNPLS